MTQTEKCLLAAIACGAAVPVLIGGGIGIVVGGTGYSLPWAMQSLIAGTGGAVTAKAFTGPVQPATPSLFAQLSAYYSSDEYKRDANEMYDAIEAAYSNVGLGWFARLLVAPCRAASNS